MGMAGPVKKRFGAPLRRVTGFTMIEVLAVLIVLAVVMTVVVSRTPDIDREAYAQAAIIRAHLRFAQSLAMGGNTDRWGISFTTNSYTLFQNGLPASVNLPNESTATHNLPNGVAITGGIGSVSFDEWGSPGAATVTIAVNGETITVTRYTGFIP
ncbi:MAG: prepilin-type N-terminal cleavage/methylation domain-containing protein [Desulfobacterales bacterium]